MTSIYEVYNERDKTVLNTYLKLNFVRKVAEPLGIFKSIVSDIFL